MSMCSESIYFVINLSIEVFYIIHGATSILDGLVVFEIMTKSCFDAVQEERAVESDSSPTQAGPSSSFNEYEGEPSTSQEQEERPTSPNLVSQQNTRFRTRF